MNESIARDNRIADFRLQSLGYVVLFNLLFFQVFLQNNYGGLFAYIDEFATVVLAIGAAVKKKREGGSAKSFPIEKLSLVFLAVALLLCSLGNAVQGIQPSIRAQAIDAFTCSKFVIATVASMWLLSDYDDLGLYIIIDFEAKVLVLIMGFCCLLNFFFDFGMGGEVRYGIRSFRFVFFHPEYVNLAVLGIIILLLAKQQANKVWLIACSLLMMSTLRGKGIAFGAFTILSLYFLGGNRKVNFLYVLAGITILAYFGNEQLLYYYSLEGGARNELTKAGITVANSLFPLGAGFATFGSAVTAEPGMYSPLYYQYGLNTVYGLAPGKTDFLSDAFWPILFGEFGWIGTSIFIASIVSLFTAIRRRCSLCDASVLIPIFCGGYLGITTLASSSVFHPTAVFLAFCTAISIGWRRAIRAGADCGARADAKACKQSAKI